MLNCHNNNGRSLTSLVFKEWVNKPVSPIQNAVSMHSIAAV